MIVSCHVPWSSRRAAIAIWFLNLVFESRLLQVGLDLPEVTDMHCILRYALQICLFYDLLGMESRTPMHYGQARYQLSYVLPFSLECLGRHAPPCSVFVALKIESGP